MESSSQWKTFLCCFGTKYYWVKICTINFHNFETFRIFAAPTKQKIFRYGNHLKKYEFIYSWDLRSKEQSYLIESAHFQGVRDLDFNPNKMYDLVTSGDDCAIKFWDIRNLGKENLQY